MTLIAPLYVRIMGSSWNQIAEPLHFMHGTPSTVCAHGQFRIEHGAHPVARLLARMLRLPQAGPSADTRLLVTTRGNQERWRRTFNGRRLDTLQYNVDQDLAERFGVFEFRFRLQASGGSLLYVQREAAFLCGPVRVRIPSPCAPRIEAREAPAGSRCIQVDVRVVLPGVGPLISYAGLVDVEEMRP